MLQRRTDGEPLAPHPGSMSACRAQDRVALCSLRSPASLQGLDRQTEGYLFLPRAPT